MRIAHGNIVTLAFDITLDGGEIVETSDLSGPISVMHGKNGLIPGLDKRLEGLKAGDERRFELLPEEAFGTVEMAPTKSIARAEFPEDADLSIGSRFEAGIAGGQRIVLMVQEVSDARVTVAMCHPLVGLTVTVELKVISVREATSSELAQGAPKLQPPPPPPGKSAKSA